MKLRFDPYQIFLSSKTPPGLYARQKWLDQAELRTWQNDFQETADHLLSGRQADGSWGRSVSLTLRRLFGLHLTVREPGTATDKALDWLTQKARESLAGHAETLKAPDLRGLPFVSGRPDYLLISATLFLASIFGRQEDADVLTLYHHLLRQRNPADGVWTDWPSTSNVLRAFVVHPEFSAMSVLAPTVEALGKIQGDDGPWRHGIPFYQMVNALGHLASDPVEIQLERAFGCLCETQAEDGTWGESEREWNTFLVIHAMRNKGLL